MGKTSILKKLSYSLGIIVLLSLFAVFPVSAQAQMADWLGVEYHMVYLNYVDFPVNITNVKNGPVMEIQFKVLYDPLVLNPVSVERGDLTKTWNMTVNIMPGEITSNLSTSSDSALPNGSTGPIISLNFSGFGDSYINFTNIMLTNTVGQSGTAPPKNGTISYVEYINVTRWISSTGEQPTHFNETNISIRPFNISLVYSTATYHVSEKKMYVLVDKEIYNDIDSYLYQYAHDVKNEENLSLFIYSGTWGTPEDVRSFLREAYSDGLVGAFLVGNIPAAWYEIDNQPEGFSRYEDFPIDLFYMDLDGNWIDNDEDGIYDNHTGNVAPEIWVGRLDATTLFGIRDEFLYRNYFAKNHMYRNFGFSLPSSALVYVDDDWYIWADGLDAEVGLLYNNSILVKDKDTTFAPDYKERLRQDYEWISLFAHSCPWAHTFERTKGIPRRSFVTSADIWWSDPHAIFYNLFACSAARFIEREYIAGEYIFADTYGLAAVGSTKTGSMLEFEHFYEPLAEGKSMGEAFKEWFTKVGMTNKNWFYGMVLLGDPTLKPTQSVEVVPCPFDFSVVNISFSEDKPVEGGNVTVYVVTNYTGEIATFTLIPIKFMVYNETHNAVIGYNYTVMSPDEDNVSVTWSTKGFLGNYTVEVRVLCEDDNPENNVAKGNITIIKGISIQPVIFDTGPGKYPSIFGTHNGTITPNVTIEVSTLYTYPCVGTGGHTNYARIWNDTGFNATAMWGGYKGDWHNITFNKTFVLYKNKTYNYTIRTGSYPQIHHTPTLPTANGWINCTEFTDANGKKYDNWIPAIKLFFSQ